MHKNYNCEVPRNIYTSSNPQKCFCSAPPLPPGNSSLASYVASRILASPPLGISNDFPWGGYGFVLELYIAKNTILTIFLCKSAGFQECDFSITIKIFFVSNKDDDNVWAGKSSGICQPVCERVVCFTAMVRIKRQPIQNWEQNISQK